MLILLDLLLLYLLLAPVGNTHRPLTGGFALLLRRDGRRGDRETGLRVVLGRLAEVGGVEEVIENAVGYLLAAVEMLDMEQVLPYPMPQFLEQVAHTLTQGYSLGKRFLALLAGCVDMLLRFLLHTRCPLLAAETGYNLAQFRLVGEVRIVRVSVEFRPHIGQVRAAEQVLQVRIEFRIAVAHCGYPQVRIFVDRRVRVKTASGEVNLAVAGIAVNYTVGGAEGVRGTPAISIALRLIWFGVGRLSLM